MAEHLDGTMLGGHKVHDLHEGGRLARARLPHQGQGLALVDLEGDVVHGAHGVAPPPEQPLALGLVGLHEVVHGQGDGALVAGHVGPFGGQRIKLGVHVLKGEALAHHPLQLVAGGQMGPRVGNGLQSRLHLVAALRCHGAARREGAARGDGRQRRGRALDGDEPVVGRLVGLGHRAQKAHGVGLHRMGKERVHVGALHDAPGVHHADVVCSAGHHGQIVGDEHHGGAGLFLGHGEHVQDLGLDGHVEGRGGLVGDDDVGVVGHSHGDDHALPHAAGELVGVGVEPLLGLGDAHHAQELHRAGAYRGGVHGRVVHEQRLGHLVADGEHGREGRERVLKDHGDALAAIGR